MTSLVPQTPEPTDEPICGEEHENAEGTWTCTLTPGHDGRHEARDGCDVVDCVLVIHAHWPNAASRSEQPTTEHLSTAMQLITQHSTHGADARIDFADAIARALAAAVQQERDKMLQVAEFVDDCARGRGPLTAEAYADIARRIREVSR